MLAIMRYGAGQPMYRMDKWQTHFGVPLSACGDRGHGQDEI
jgi:hypothetical protein